MIGDKKFQVRGGFGPELIIAADNLAEWAQKEAEKNMREKDPILRAFNAINVGLNDGLMPPMPMSEADMQALESFPFHQINTLAAPSANQRKVLEVQQRLPEEFLKASSLGTVDTAGISKAFGLPSTQANEFLRYIRGEIKTI